MAFGMELIEYSLHVYGIPQNEHIDDQAKRAKLVFLAFAVTLAEFATAAVKYFAGQAMTALATIELGQNTAAVSFIGDETQQVEGFGNAP